MIGLFEPQLAYDELEAVKDTFASRWIGRGRRVMEFEAAWAKHINTRTNHVIALPCATEGLFEAVSLCGVWPGDEVIIPSIHFSGALNAILAQDGEPVFCDVDERTLSPRLSDILPKITKKTKAVILNHYGGIPCEIDKIRDNLDVSIKIIDDAANAPASLLRGNPTAQWGNYSVWSFDAMKIMSTGDGGMLYCRSNSDAQLARKELYLGQSVVSGMSNDSPRWWEFGIDFPGRRAIMNDITAAIGLVQLGKLQGFVDRRHWLWDKYNEQLAGIDGLLTPPPVPDYCQSSYYLYWVQTPLRDELAHYLKANGIYTTYRYYPLHLAWTHKRVSLPNSEKINVTTLNLPLHQGLSDGQVDFICDKIREFYGKS